MRIITCAHVSGQGRPVESQSMNRNMMITTVTPIVEGMIEWKCDICMVSLENCVSLGRLSHDQCACAYIQQCHIAHFDPIGVQTLNSALENTRVRDTHEGTTVLMILRSTRSGERGGTGAKLMHVL